jgi:hypothetical protein
MASQNRNSRGHNLPEVIVPYNAYSGVWSRNRCWALPAATEKRDGCLRPGIHQKGLMSVRNLPGTISPAFLLHISLDHYVNAFENVNNINPTNKFGISSKLWVGPKL